MRYEWFISLRYLKSGRGWNIRLISAISIFGVLLGVAALVLVLSVMGGFAADLREKILATKAHVVVDAHSGSLADWTEMLEVIQANPEVVGASPYVQSELMISTATTASMAKGLKKLVTAVARVCERSVTCTCRSKAIR